MRMNMTDADDDADDKPSASQRDMAMMPRMMKTPKNGDDFDAVEKYGISMTTKRKGAPAHSLLP